jgi:hypothetical protein
MELDKFVNCECGKKKKIKWLNKKEYHTGEYTFCVGKTKCSRCGMQQQHYSGDMNDIQKFINELNEINRTIY